MGGIYFSRSPESRKNTQTRSPGVILGMDGRVAVQGVAEKLVSDFCWRKLLHHGPRVFPGVLQYQGIFSLLPLDGPEIRPTSSKEINIFVYEF